MSTDTIALLDKHFDLAVNAPDGIKRLREMILTLAMQGKLVPQDPKDQPASELLKDIEAEKKRLVKAGKIKEPKPLPPIKPEEVPYEVPTSWEWVKLGQIGETNIGLTYSPSNVSDIGIPVLRSSNIQNGALDFDDLVRVEMDVKESAMVREGDILICARNGSKALVGKSALITGLNEPMAFGAFMAIFRSSVNNYLLRFINSPLFRRMIDEVNTMTINQITQDNLRNTIFPLPPLAEQRRIVAKIDELMARVDELERKRDARNEKRLAMHQAAIARLLDAGDANASRAGRNFIFAHFGELYGTKENVAELRKAILQLAVMGRLVHQDPKDQAASELLKEIEAEKKRLVQEGKIKEPKPLPPIKPEEVPYQVPKGWEWVRLGEICNGITSGSTPPANEFKTSGIPFLKVYNIRNQVIDFSYKEQFVSDTYSATKLARSRLFPGDVIMNIVGPPLGKVAIVPDTYPVYNCNQAIVFFRPYISDINIFIYTFLCVGDFLKRIELIGTAGQDNISVTKSNMIEFPLPPLAEQRRIVAKVDELMALCDKLDKKIDEQTTKESALLEAVAARV